MCKILNLPSDIIVISSNYNIMIKRILSIAVLTVAIAISTQAQRIAIVDINDVLTSFSDYQAAEKEIDKLSAGWSQEVAQELDKVKSMYNKYQAEQVLLSPDQKKEREDEIIMAEEEVQKLQRKRFGPEGDLFLKRQELVAPIQDKVFAAIEDFAADRGYDVIFDKSGSAGLLFVTDEFDKTEDVKKRLGIK